MQKLGYFIFLSAAMLFQDTAYGGTLTVIPDETIFLDGETLNQPQFDAITAEANRIGAITFSTSAFTGSSGAFNQRALAEGLDVSLLGGFDLSNLLTFDIVSVGTPALFNPTSIPLSATQIGTLRDYLGSGGDIVVQIQSWFPETVPVVNNFLAELGSTIRYSTTLLGFGPGTNNFRFNGLTGLTGGSALSTFQGFTVLAEETFIPVSVPEPFSFIMMLMGVLSLIVTRHWAKHL